MDYASQLVQLVYSQTQSALESRKLQRISRLEFSSSANEFSYTDGFNVSSLSISQIEKIYPDGDIASFTKSILESEEYEDIITLIRLDLPHIERHSLTWHVMSLIYRIIRNESQIDSDTEALKADLNLLPHSGHIDIWISGIYLTEESFDLGDGIFIRKFNEYDVAHDPRYSGMARGGMEMNYPSAILVIPARKTVSPYEYAPLHVILRILSLTGIGTVRHVATIPHVNTLHSVALGVTSSVQPWPTHVRYAFDSASQKRFLNIKRIVEESLIVQSYAKLMSEDWTPFIDLNTAFDRYESALTAKSVDVKVARLMEAVEAILGENSGEVKRRVCQRAALILGLTGQDAISSFSILSKCYDHRSTHAHGGRLTGKNLKHASDISPTLTQLVHTLLVTILLARQVIKDRADFLSLLDSAMIDMEKHQNLAIMLQSISLLD